MAPEEPRLIDDVVDLAALVELRDIIFFQVHAERLSSGPGSENELHEVNREDEGQQIGIQIQERHSETRIEVRCVLHGETRDARYVIDAAAQYEVEAPVVISPEVVEAFVERVGIMAVYPYLREALQSAAAKLRLDAPVLGLLRPGGVKLTTEDPRESAE
ncbi:hypothetical protein [Phycicoccus flavus]|uniref:hypothetical protein n=1 Tax=Phycicoccus flavus TaxID=2502783 RepID=UPI000FEBC5D6|nr:hypothetical protein [Phycicoccus flavus]NHA68223.1 hypothetical protein [Phycicoccus flavus]